MQLPPRCFEYSEEEDFLILLDGFIDELDEEADRRQYIYCICGLEMFKDDLTQRVLERYLDKIVEQIEELRFEYYVDGPYGECAERSTLRLYYVLAILIFETGSAFPDKVKNVILNKKLDWAEEAEGMNYFKQRIREHIPGTPLREEISKALDKRAQDYRAFEGMLYNIFPRKFHHNRE